jgi:hypothetical protein
VAKIYIFSFIAYVSENKMCKIMMCFLRVLVKCYVGFKIVDDDFRHECGFKCQQSKNINASSKLKQSVSALGD